ncbi:MAG: response regulator [Pyrinomonadaceae bacterium]|nr:response regulator [Pyrinomonadaceae bacterium]
MFAVDNIEKRILIVDDESDVREILSDLLCNSFECICTESAEDALKQVCEKPFAVVITDIGLAGMNGLELLSHIKNESPTTVSIVISGQKTINDAVTALRAGAFDYILKPFDLFQVETAVHRAIEHHELQIIKRRYDLHLEELVSQRTTELDSALEELENSYRATLKALVQALETRDFETHGHSERVVTFSLRLGHEIGLDAKEMQALEFGALLHDVGKIGVPDAILRKPAQLTEDEWKIMRLHPTHGQKILRGIPFLKNALKVVAQHHEKWDGSGYPKKLKGEEIDIKARIFSVVDAFDAITSNRVYRAGRPYKEALAEIENNVGSQFDSEIVNAFRRIPEEDWEKLRTSSLENERESFNSIVAEIIKK